MAARRHSADQHQAGRVPLAVAGCNVTDINTYVRPRQLASIVAHRQLAAPVAAGFRLIGIGLSVWTLAVAGCGAAFNFWSLVICRMFVGVGEASFVSLASPFIGAASTPFFRTLYWQSCAWIRSPPALSSVSAAGSCSARRTTLAGGHSGGNSLRKRPQFFTMLSDLPSQTIMRRRRASRVGWRRFTCAYPSATPSATFSVAWSAAPWGEALLCL